MSRAPADVLDEALALLPSGWGLARDRESNTAASFAGLADMLSSFEASAEVQLQEIDPRSAAELLPDYERVLGPTPCGIDLSTLSPVQRGLLAWLRWTARGGASIPYFTALAATLGWPISIREARPYYPDLSSSEDYVMTEDAAFMWMVVAPYNPAAYEPPGAATNPLAPVSPALLECLLRADCPAHTTMVLAITGAPLDLFELDQDVPA